MINTDKYETDHPELVEFEGETLGDTLTNLITEVKRLREQLEMWKRWLNQGADNKMEDGDVWDIIFHQSGNECLSDCEEYEDSKCWNCETKKLKEMIE